MEEESLSIAKEGNTVVSLASIRESKYSSAHPSGKEQDISGPYLSSGKIPEESEGSVKKLIKKGSETKKISLIFLPGK